MVVSRLSDLVLPMTSKYLMDDVITQHHWELLPKLAIAVSVATLVGAATSFLNSQVLGVAAQRAIAEMRKEVEAHVMRLPIRYFDSTKTGVLISRIMTDADGVRNIVGTGLVQLTGSILTATIAFSVLMYINWRLTVVTSLILSTFGIGMATAFKRLRPLFRERSQINAEVTGRLAESLGGVRIVKAYTAEKREELVFAKGAHRLFRNVAKSMTGTSAVMAFSSLVVGASGVAMMLIGGAAIRDGTMTIGDLVKYLSFTALMTMPIFQLASVGTQITEAFAGLDRIREIRRMATEDQEDASARAAAGRPGRGDVRRRELRVPDGRAGPEARVVPRPGRVDDRARRLERIRQEHAHQPGDDLQPPHHRPAARRRPGPDAGAPARLPRAPRRGAAGQLPLRRHDRREHQVRAGLTPRSTRSARSAGSPTATSSSRRSTSSTTRSSASAACACPADSGSAWRSRARFWRTRAS